MNKKLVAVAIAGLLAAPLAQAQTANVTLYGRLHMDVEVVNGKIVSPGVQPATCTALGTNLGITNGTVDGCATSNPNQFRVASNSSRFGLRGTESLGGGLNAIFQIETSLSPDIGTGTLAGRDSFLGLQGSWGTFRMGRFHSPYDDLHEIFGSVPTLQTGILASSAIWAQGFSGDARNQFDDRVSNSVRWDSPIMAGFKVEVQYGNGPGGVPEGTSATQASNSGVWAGAVLYNNGPVVVGLGYRQNMQTRNRSLNDYAWSAAASYQFPNVKVGVVYEKLDYDCSITATTGANAGAVQRACDQVTNGVKTDLTRNFYAVGVTVNAGPGVIYGLYGRGVEGKGSAPDGARIAGLAKGDASAANMYEVSYNYPLSRRTQVYAGYVKINNDENAAYNFGVNNYQIAIGGKPQGVILGMFHNF